MNIKQEKINYIISEGTPEVVEKIFHEGKDTGLVLAISPCLTEEDIEKSIQYGKAHIFLVNYGHSAAIIGIEANKHGVTTKEDVNLKPNGHSHMSKGWDYGEVVKGYITVKIRFIVDGIDRGWRTVFYRKEYAFHSQCLIFTIK